MNPSSSFVVYNMQCGTLYIVALSYKIQLLSGGKGTEWYWPRFDTCWSAGGTLSQTVISTGILRGGRAHRYDTVQMKD